MSKPYTPTYKTLNWPAYRAVEAPLVRANGEGSAQAPGLADDLVRPGHDMGCDAQRQAWATASLQRRVDPDLPDDEGPVRHGVAADDWFRREPAAPA
jgi:hypothetical protein